MSLDGVEARRAALGALEAQAPSVLAQGIVLYLSDDDWRVRKDAASVAARHLEAADLAETLAQGVLQGEDVGLRNASIEALASAGGNAARQRVIHRSLAALEEQAPHTALKFLCAAWVGGGPFALAPLSRHARDPDSTTATAALEALARIGGRPAEEELSAILFAGGDDVVRLAALEGLLSLRARLDARRLLALLAEPLFLRPTLRALGFTTDPLALPALVERLSAPRFAGVASLALAQLAETSELRDQLGATLRNLAPTALTHLLTLANGSEEAEARAALLVLLLAREPTSLLLVGAFAARAEPGRPLLEALRRFGSAAVPGLLEALKDAEPVAAAWSLEAAVELAGLTNDPALIEPIRAALRQAVTSPHEVLKVASLRGLSRFGQAQDAGRLVTLGARGGTPIAAAASEAIAALSTAAPEAVEEALEGRALEGNDAPLAWSKAVRALPRPLALEKLSAAAAGEDAQARQAAIEALVYLEGDEAAELAAVALADEDEGVRLAGVRTLGALAALSSRAAGALKMALRSQEPAMRAAAIRSASTHDLSLDDEVAFLGGDSNPEVLAALFRAGAHGNALGAPGRVALLRLLPRALGDADEEVVKSALAALCNLRGDGIGEALAAGLNHHAWDVRLDAARLAAKELARDTNDVLTNDDALGRALAARRAVEEDDLVRAAIDMAFSGRGAGPE